MSEITEVYTSAFLRDEIARLIAPNIEMRRRSRLGDDEGYLPDDSPVSPEEVEDFILNCWTLDAPLINALLDDEGSYQFNAEEFAEFQYLVDDWATNPTWLGGDTLLTDDGQEIPYNTVFMDTKPKNVPINRHKEERYEHLELFGETAQKISILAPHIGILQKLAEKAIDIDSLRWRELEELIAELLDKDGYKVQLGQGSKDGGADIIATKEIEGIGFFKGVWQAKKLKSGKKVGIGVIRELADTRQEMKASKGIIVTSTFLTRDAIERVKRDKYLLGKVEKPDLESWIDRVIRGR